MGGHAGNGISGLIFLGQTDNQVANDAIFPRALGLVRIERHRIIAIARLEAQLARRARRAHGLRLTTAAQH